MRKKQGTEQGREESEQELSYQRRGICVEEVVGRGGGAT
jgi:hypothetical protein